MTDQMNADATLFAAYADRNAYEVALGDMTSVQLKIEYRRVFGKYPTKEFSADDAMIVKLLTAYDKENAPAETETKAEKAPKRSIAELLAMLAAETDAPKKKGIRAALRRQGYKISEQAKPATDAAENEAAAAE